MFKYAILAILLVLYIYYLIKDKTQLILSLGLILLFIIFNVYYVERKNNTLSNNIIGTVIEIEEKCIIIEHNNYYILTYTNEKFEIGDVLDCSLKYSKIKNKSYDTDFDLKEYYYSKKIFHIASLIDYKLVDNKFCINKIKYRIVKYLDKMLDDNTFMYVKTIVLGVNDLEDDLKDGYSLLGISHILAISGLHIMLLYKVLTIAFKRYLNIRYDLIPIITISIYVIIIGLPPACFRALLFLIIGSYDKYKSNKFTKLDILSISFIITLLIKPYIFYSSSFILTYLVSFLLCFSNDLIKVKSKLLSNYLVYIFIYFITFPIVIGFNNYLSITSFILSPILTIISTVTIIPLSFLVFLCPWLNWP
jgi:competence protein ComEC